MQGEQVGQKIEYGEPCPSVGQQTQKVEGQKFETREVEDKRLKFGRWRDNQVAKVTHQ